MPYITTFTEICNSNQRYLWHEFHSSIQEKSVFICTSLASKMYNSVRQSEMRHIMSNEITVASAMRQVLIGLRCTCTYTCAKQMRHGVTSDTEEVCPSNFSPLYSAPECFPPCFRRWISWN